MNFNLHHLIFASLRAVETSCKHNIEIVSYFNVDMVSMLVTSCLITHPADTEQHEHSSGVMFVSS